MTLDSREAERSCRTPSCGTQPAHISLDRASPKHAAHPTPRPKRRRQVNPVRRRLTLDDNGRQAMRRPRRDGRAARRRGARRRSARSRRARGRATSAPVRRRTRRGRCGRRRGEEVEVARLLGAERNRRHRERLVGGVSRHHDPGLAVGVVHEPRAVEARRAGAAPEVGETLEPLGVRRHGDAVCRHLRTAGGRGRRRRLAQVRRADPAPDSRPGRALAATGATTSRPARRAVPRRSPARRRGAGSACARGVRAGRPVTGRRATRRRRAGRQRPPRRGLEAPRGRPTWSPPGRRPHIGHLGHCSAADAEARRVGQHDERRRRTTPRRPRVTRSPTTRRPGR